jgi:transketolase
MLSKESEGRQEPSRGVIASDSEELIRDISAKAQQLRIDVLKMVYRAQSGHIGGAFSAAEIIAALYFHHLRIDPLVPGWPGRDRFILSKGHACALLYAALAHRGFFPLSELETFRQLDDHCRVPGVEVSAGPLGHGVAIGAGIALVLRDGAAAPFSLDASRLRSSLPRVYVLVGDGEIDAGVVWEGALFASKHRLGNLTVILDCNGIQQTGPTAAVLPIEPIEAKWLAFGWSVGEVDGHDVRKILHTLDEAAETRARPSMILARTTKGKGVSFMENDHKWHGRPPDREQYEAALSELEEGRRQWQD